MSEAAGNVMRRRSLPPGVDGCPTAVAPFANKPPPPCAVVLADAKITLHAPIPRAFEALLNPDGSVEKGVAWSGLSPEGLETFVHLVHRAPKSVAGEWAVV